MLSNHEKAYCQALLALRQKDFPNALENFEKAALGFGTNSEFNLLYQSTRLLSEVKKEMALTAPEVKTEEKELLING